MKLLQYPQTNDSEQLKRKIVALLCTAWPLTDGEKIEEVIWPENKDIHKTSFVLMDGEIAISHVAVVGKSISHEGHTYQAYGLAEVVTHPDYLKHGYGLQLIQEARRFIDEEKHGDISVFTCKKELVPFYEKAGWEHMKNTCLVGGTRHKPFCSDLLGLATMMYFHSLYGQKDRMKFENADLYLELNEGKLW